MDNRLTRMSPLGWQLYGKILVRGDVSVYYDAIRKLAAYENTGLTPDEIAALRAELDAAQRRAEAAVRDLASAALCENCKHVDNDECGETCGDSDSAYRWEWRGPDAPSKEAQP